jgi:hypothetical protein
MIKSRILRSGSEAAVGRFDRNALRRKGIGRLLSVGGGDWLRFCSQLILRLAGAANYFAARTARAKNAVCGKKLSGDRSRA